MPDGLARTRVPAIPYYFRDFATGALPCGIRSMFGGSSKLKKELKFQLVRTFWEPAVAIVGRRGANDMATLAQQNLYQCSQCGNRELTAAPVLYGQGTRNYSGIFRWGNSQSHTAQVSAPPRPRGYVRPSLLWGIPAFVLLLWTYAGVSVAFEHTKFAERGVEQIGVFFVLGLCCLAGLVFSLNKVFRFNREVYPSLHQDWEHTYMCKRCGNLCLINQK